MMKPCSLRHCPIVMLLTTSCFADADAILLGDVDYLDSLPAPIDDENDLAAYVAQCEAVLGPVPEISCDPEHPAPGTRVTRIPVLLDGELIGFGDPTMGAAILADRAASGDYRCDFPSIGGDFPCTIGSTLVQADSEASPNVQWVGLCRGARRDVPTYDRFIGNGLIGANEKTGEMCFFFGVNPDPEQPYVLPRLRSADPSGAPEDLSPWLPPRDMPGSCLSCHPNNDPWVLTPWLGPAYHRQTLLDPAYPLRLPAGVQVDDLLAARHVRLTPDRAKLPDNLPRGRTAWTEEEVFDGEGRLVHRQYRAVGSSYVDNEVKGLVKPRTGIQPSSWTDDFRVRLRHESDATSCSCGCHALSTEHARHMAFDAVGQKFSAYLSDTMAAGIEDHSSAVPGFTWMPPVPTGRDLGNGGGSIFAITPCPIPSRLPEDAVDLSVDCGSDVVELSWPYRVTFGDVQGRDDVRFAVAYGSSHGPARGVHRNGIEGVAMATEDGARVIDNVGPDGESRIYRVALPLPEIAGEMAIDLQPKRLCFEEPDRPFAYARPTRVIVDRRDFCG